MRTLVYISLLLCFIRCSVSRPASTATIQSLRLLDTYIIPHNLSFNGTTVGGLSGIDYDTYTDTYVLISDDRSAINPARFYKAAIQIKDHKIDTVIFKDHISFLQADGTVYPNNKQNPFRTPDPESIRLYNNLLVWTSEGERTISNKDTILLNPSINIIQKQGKLIDSFPIPANLWMKAIEKGPRKNGVLEGLSLTPNKKQLFTSLEEPLYEDGPRAELKDTSAWIRLFSFETNSKKNIAQYAYRLDPIAFAPNPADGFKVNGISDILLLNNKQLLVIERSFSFGRLHHTIKVYLADISNATNIIDYTSLQKETAFKPVTKKLLLNMDELGIHIDNIEGICFGPRLANGKRSLFFVVDNNFNAIEKAQILLFEVND